MLSISLLQEDQMTQNQKWKLYFS